MFAFVDAVTMTTAAHWSPCCQTPSQWALHPSSSSSFVYRKYIVTCTRTWSLFHKHYLILPAPLESPAQFVAWIFSTGVLNHQKAAAGCRNSKYYSCFMADVFSSMLPGCGTIVPWPKIQRTYVQRPAADSSSVSSWLLSSSLPFFIFLICSTYKLLTVRFIHK